MAPASTAPPAGPPSPDDVAAARDRGELPHAISLAHRAWLATRAPEVALALEALDAALPAPETSARTKKTFQAAWLAEAGRASVASVGWLAATLEKLLPVAPRSRRHRTYAQRHAALLARVAALRALGPDPRVARALASLVAHGELPAWDPDGVDDLHGPLFDALVGAGDPRQAEALEAVLARPVARGSAARDYQARALPAVVARLRALPPPVRVASGWSAFGRRGPSGDPRAGEALLARVLVDPDDDVARQVYADWLLERGDPHGELITLQTKPGSGRSRDLAQKRAASLVRAHRDTLLGPELAKVFKRVEYARGFLVRAALARNASASTDTWARAPSDPRLATVEELFRGSGSAAHYEAFVGSPTMVNLRVLDLPSAAVLEVLLARGAPTRVERVRLERVPTRALLARLAASAAFPGLARLTVVVGRARVERFRADVEDSGLEPRVRVAVERG